MSANYDNINLDQNTRRRLNLGTPCANFTSEERCEECNAELEYRSRMRKTNNPAEKAVYDEKIKMLQAKSKIFVNAVNAADPMGEFPAQIYVLPPTVYDDIVNQAKGVRQMHPEINIFNPSAGCKIIITRTGQGLGTRYRVQIDTTTGPLPNMDAINHVYNLSKVEEMLRSQPQLFHLLEPGPNILRLLPPWDDRNLLYHEIKFHRFRVDQVSNGDNSGFQNVTAGDPGMIGADAAPFDKGNFGATPPSLGSTPPPIGDTTSDIDTFFNNANAGSKQPDPVSQTVQSAVADPTPTPTPDPVVPETLAVSETPAGACPPVQNPAQDSKESQIEALLKQAQELRQEVGSG